MKKTTKDAVSNYAGVALAVSGAILTAGTTYKLPTSVISAAGIVASVSGGVIAYLTGKGADGKVKP